MKIYIVGVHLNERVPMGILGFSSYALVYVHATDCEGAVSIATEHYLSRSWLRVLGTTCKEAAIQDATIMQGFNIRTIFF